MTQEEKLLLLRDLGARLPYGVKGRVYAETTNGQYDLNGDLIFFDSPFDVTLDGVNVSTEEIHVVAIGNEDTVEFIEIQQTDGFPYTIDDFEPYLRPISNMTEEEKKELTEINCQGNLAEHKYAIFYRSQDWLNAHHFDYRGLIEKCIAIEVTEENNPYKD